MIRRRMFGAMLLLAVALTACSDGEPFGLEAFAIEEDDLTSELVSESGVADLRGTSDPSRGSGNTLFERLAANIPGFGGLYRTAQCHVVVVLTSAGDRGQAFPIVRAAVEPLVQRTCPDGIRLEAVAGDFTYVELMRWLLASRPLNRIDGVRGAYVDFKANRLVIVVESRAVAARVLSVLDELGIPQRAVLFRASAPPVRTR